ncbi:hypothetical protein LCGC14_0225110 [marine sediment metagenome]|uniref:Uncharacterized protein n=1 Tax=marine sediment metagenome TaxID=412755 RepID=A0A0F9UTX7_9ZZZZ
MTGYIWDMIYGLVMMSLMLIINIFLSKLLDIDIYLLFFCNIIFLLTVIWYRLDRDE